MSRPGFALKVDEHTPQLLTLAGDRVRLQRFPIGTEVIYPPQPVASSDPVALVEGATSCSVSLWEPRWSMRHSPFPRWTRWD